MAAAAGTQPAAQPAPEKKVKPTKPDEEAFKAELAKAEKEHAAIQEKLVCCCGSPLLSLCVCTVHTGLSTRIQFAISPVNFGCFTC